MLHEKSQQVIIVTPALLTKIAVVEVSTWCKSRLEAQHENHV